MPRGSSSRPSVDRRWVRLRGYSGVCACLFALSECLATLECHGQANFPGTWQTAHESSDQALFPVQVGKPRLDGYLNKHRLGRAQIVTLGEDTGVFGRLERLFSQGYSRKSLVSGHPRPEKNQYSTA